MVWTENRNVRTAHRLDEKIVASGRPAKIWEVLQNCFLDTETVDRPDT